MQRRRFISEDCIEQENEMRTACFSRAATSERNIGSSHKLPVGHQERDVMPTKKLQEHDLPDIALFWVAYIEFCVKRSYILF